MNDTIPGYEIRAVHLLQDSALVATLLSQEANKNGHREWLDVRVAGYLTVEIDSQPQVVAAVRYRGHLLPVWAVPGYEFHAITDLGRGDTAYAAAYGAQPAAPAEFLREENATQRAANRQSVLEHMARPEHGEAAS